MPNARLLPVLAAIALAAGCRPPAPPTSPAVTEAERRAQPILTRYGIEALGLRMPAAAVQARERGSGVPVERALALAIEALVADREDPDSAAALALAAGSASPCPRSSPVRAMVCYLARDGSRVELARPAAAALTRREAHYVFAFRIPALATRPFLIAVSAAPSGDLVAAPIRAPECVSARGR